MTNSPEQGSASMRAVYLATLSRCAPDRVLRDAVDRGRLALPADVGSIVAIGKCAVPLAAAAAKLTGATVGLVIHPSGYEGDSNPPPGFERVEGSHPIPSRSSRHAAMRAVAMVRAQTRPILFLVSGGASACMEDALSPHVTLDEVVRINEVLLASGLPIEEMNSVRRHLSSVKGGRLGLLAPRGSVTLVFSDVPPGRPDLVGSGPTADDPSTLEDAAAVLRRVRDPLAERMARLLESGSVPETPKEAPTTLLVIADSETMIDVASEECRERERLPRRGPSLDGPAEDVARRLVDAVGGLKKGEVLISAGESTVEVRGGGRGGRCTELASRFVLVSDEAGCHGFGGVFGSSDGKDGTSPAGAVVVRPSISSRLDPAKAAEALRRSDSYELVADYGEPIIMMPTGNNLRDIVLLFREE